MYNLLSKENMKVMLFRGRMIKGIITGLIIGFLSFLFLFSNHPFYALAVTAVVVVYLCFAPEKKRTGINAEERFIYPEKGSFTVRLDVPEYSLKELKPATQEALFDAVVDRATTEAEAGNTEFLIWHVGKSGVQSKFCISKNMPGQNLGGSEISLRGLLTRIFG